MEKHLKALAKLSRDVRILTGNTLANEILDEIGNIRKAHAAAMDSVRELTSHVPEDFLGVGAFHRRAYSARNRALDTARELLAKEENA